mmetsp:Transcript_13317/g.40366  ORF Transcript_13317/g.40366 Transcript_13317/m.40366 type:complete len:254 (-) Transcript_13317:890-1651(-)
MGRSVRNPLPMMAPCLILHHHTHTGASLLSKPTGFPVALYRRSLCDSRVYTLRLGRLGLRARLRTSIRFRSRIESKRSAIRSVSGWWGRARREETSSSEQRTSGLRSPYLSLPSLRLRDCSRSAASACRRFSSRSSFVISEVMGPIRPSCFSRLRSALDAASAASRSRVRFARASCCAVFFLFTTSLAPAATSESSLSSSSSSSSSPIPGGGNSLRSEPSACIAANRRRAASSIRSLSTFHLGRSSRRMRSIS